MADNSRSRIRRRGERGSTMVEAVFTMLVILLVLFGLLQIFQISMAQMITDFASFRAARSAAVGFNDHFVGREARVHVIGASGSMVYPERSSSFSGMREQFAYEKIAIEEYLNGTRWMEYEYWDGHNAKHTDYRCPNYGQDIGNETSGPCKCRTRKRPDFAIGVDSSADETRAHLVFRNYPFTMPLRDFYMPDGNFNVQSKAAMSNYATDFLEN